MTAHPPGAVAVLLRIATDSGENWFAGYVILNSRDEVIEKSASYGMFEQQADIPELRDGAECIPVTRSEFALAWQRPYAKRSLKRRFLGWLAGLDDSRDPSENDAAKEWVPADQR